MSKDSNYDLFAFWPYDSFPYVLGGTVTKITDKGAVETIEYGPGRYFRATKILPLAAGKKLKETLDRLTKVRNSALKKFNDEWNKKLEDIDGFNVKEISENK